MTGRVPHRGQSLAFESSLERDWLILLNWDPTVNEIVEQPVTISYRDKKGTKRTYTPDCYASFSRGGRLERIIYEIKYREELKADWNKLRPKFKAAVHYCKTHGMRFKVVTEKEIRTHYLANVKFLRSYLDVPQNTAVEAHLARTLASLGDASPEKLLIAGYWTHHEQMLALPHLWRMIASKRVMADLSDPLNMKTPIWIVVGEGFIWEDPRFCD